MNTIHEKKNYLTLKSYDGMKGHLHVPYMLQFQKYLIFFRLLDEIIFSAVD